MKALFVAAGMFAAALGGTVLATNPAQAAGCISGAVVGGAAGHVAGHHGVLGAAAGCAIGHHEAKKNAAARQQQQAPATPSR